MLLQNAFSILFEIAHSNQMHHYSLAASSFLLVAQAASLTSGGSNMFDNSDVDQPYSYLSENQMSSPGGPNMNQQPQALPQFFNTALTSPKNLLPAENFSLTGSPFSINGNQLAEALTTRYLYQGCNRPVNCEICDPNDKDSNGYPSCVFAELSTEADHEGKKIGNAQAVEAIDTSV